MYPWRKVLIPTDFSTATQWVFDDAIRAAAGTGAEILILHVRMAHRSNPEALRYPADPAVYEYVEQQQLDLLRSHVVEVNPAIATRLLVRMSPDPAGEIHRVAAEEHADLIVMATHARHHIARLIIGSTTSKILQSCAVPVLAMRYGIRKRLATRRILVPFAGSRPAAGVAALARAMAMREGSEVHLLATEGREADLDPSFGGVTLRWRVVEPKSLARDALRYADEQDIDLTLVPPDCSPDGKIGELTEGIVRNISTPVLVVPVTSQVID
jgi:universal stress protein A